MGILHGESSLAQHIVGEAVAFIFQWSGDGQRLVDRSPKHELLAHDAHGLFHGIADNRLAGARHQLLEIAPDIAACDPPQIDETPGQHQSPGGRVDEQRFRLPQVPLPVLATHLVGDQLVSRSGIGDAQQRFRQTHQHHALFRRQ